MDQFIGKFVQTSSNNMEGYLTAFGQADKIPIYNSKPRVLEVSKLGAVYTNKMFTNGCSSVNEFELDKEFDATLPDGTPCRAVMTLDGNRLVERRTRRGIIEIENIREFVGNELRMTITIGSVISGMTFARQ
ncbi:unnamed protein product [Oppiella nova]|uniref:Lipocalin/cytosolic fatty-acid binding domain-containing protein n=1 Tax=Oppiella nova TaxID=334625 RepID=A0A7R9QPF9_9ACAR|nr:unnamed protein product [Oppiella nova]CAG2170618.1 unnamed protein product [Oppiella nova]